MGGTRLAVWMGGVTSSLLPFMNAWLQERLHYLRRVREHVRGWLGCCSMGVVLRPAMLCGHVVLCGAMPCHAMPMRCQCKCPGHPHAMPPRAMPRPCAPMPCPALPCHAMPCHCPACPHTLALHAPPRLQGDVGEVMFAVRSDLLRNLGNMTNRQAAAFFCVCVFVFFSAVSCASPFPAMVRPRSLVATWPAGELRSTCL